MNFTSKQIMSKKGLTLLGKIFNSSSEGIMFFNHLGEVIMVNPRALQMFGYDEDDLKGKKVEELIPVNIREAHLQYRKAYMEKPERRSMGLGRDLVGLKKDGNTFPIEVSLSHLENEGETIIVAFVIDISIRKENERVLQEQRLKLQEYTNELERKVKSRTSELEHMNMGLQSQIQERKLAEEALRQSLSDLQRAEKEILLSLEKEKELGELKSRFVSMASHEFRTPLTTILSSANLILKYTEADQQPSREKHVERIKKSVQNLTNILNDFLSLEKLESGSQNLAFDKINLNELILEVIEEMEPTLKPGQRIEKSLNNLKIQSDPHILKNIFFNLISNASKYSNENDAIKIDCGIENGFVVVTVADEGIGIPEEEQKNMFERFFRAQNVINIKGTGLGLNIVKKYLDLLNGKIAFESQLNKGSVFKVYLPK